ncbi:MAG: anhydro-N-acetylmuramic acid kinase, partial [Proteobacteria bacterium]|nr:anhydro-N-acetylmuramic acid kinase [Pseudomonadota bacterium]
MARLFIGLMSGTSVDAIDAVLMDLSGSDTRLLAHFSQPIDVDLKREINRVIAARAWPQETTALDSRFAAASVEVIARLLEEAAVRADQVEAVGSHGQTVFHDPQGTPPVSIQLGNAGEIAHGVGIPTVGNFRKADIDAGGQGAPLACAYHARVFRSEHEDRAILNLGGIANLTFLPQDPSLGITGFDTGPANTLSDAWVQHCRGLDFDQDGD